MIDKKVIDGHIISDHVVFTSSAPTEDPFETLAFDDNIKVTISFFTQGEGKNMKSKSHQPDPPNYRGDFPLTENCFSISFYTAYVKSNTVVGDSKHSTGVVMAEILRANIPVKNGVVHLIHRPLMVVDTTVTQFLQVSRRLLSIHVCVGLCLLCILPCDHLLNIT